jgi:hypothetical protein
VLAKFFFFYFPALICFVGGDDIAFNYIGRKIDDESEFQLASTRIDILSGYLSAIPLFMALFVAINRDPLSQLVDVDSNISRLVIFMLLEVGSFGLGMSLARRRILLRRMSLLKKQREDAELKAKAMADETKASSGEDDPA